MNKKRPVNLDLMTIKFPPMAIASILHRFSGVLLFFAIPFLLYMLDASLSTPASFVKLKACLVSPMSKFMLWLAISGLIYHLVAGIRHMIMDMGWGESLAVARASSLSVMAIAIVLSLGMGIWLW